MIDPTALRSLVALAQEGSVHAAAAALGYTPSAVSQQIKRLERDAGAALVERVGRSLVLTAGGAALVEEADDLLRRMEAVEARVRRSNGRAEGAIRLAAFSTALRGVVPLALCEMRRSAPDVEVALSEIDPWDAVDAVAAGRVDCAIVHNWDPMPLTLPSHLTAVDLGVDQADVVLSARHRLAARDALTPADLRGENWVSVGAGSICHQWLTWVFHEIGERPAVVHEVLEYETQLALVEPANVLALIPRLGRSALSASLAAVPLAVPATRRVQLVHRTSMTEHPALRALVGAVRSGADDVLADGGG